MLQILGQVYRRHAAGTELALDPVAVGQGSGEPFKDRVFEMGQQTENLIRQTRRVLEARRSEADLRRQLAERHRELAEKQLALIEAQLAGRSVKN